MEIVVTSARLSASASAAAFIAGVVRRKPDTVLGLATGSTPLALYAELVRLHVQEGLDFSRCTSFNLDEYIGLAATHRASYRRFMDENLFSQINLPAERIHIPDGMARDVRQHCLDYEAAIRGAGGIDVQVLGIGTDGHIGFNEPTSSLSSRTRIKTLTQRTMRDNARFFSDGEEVPRHVITMGIGTILETRSVVLLAFGEEKAAAVAEMVEGPLTAMVPASALQLHPEAKIFLDEAAASRLKKREYYDHVFANKPGWQRWDTTVVADA